MKDRRRMFPHRARLVAGALFASAVALAAACGNDQAVVGGTCAASYIQCGTRCVDLANDPANCGHCGVVCDLGILCAEGQCQGLVPGDGSMADDADGAGRSDRGGRGDNDAISFEVDSPVNESSLDSATDGTNPLDGVGADGNGTSGDASFDGTVFEGASGDALLPDGSLNDGASSEASTVDGAPTGDGASDALAADACVPPYDGPAHCGSCANSCSPPLPFCALVGSTFTCVPDCTPLTDCAGACTDLTSDPLNCGSCGTVCPSQICSQSMCIGSIAGALVVIGHDYANALAGTSEARVLANAVFLWPYDPIHVLSYERYADAAVVGRIKALLGASALRFGRALDIRSTTNDNDVTGSLSTRNFGVLLVADQVNAQGANLGALGASWAPVVASFTAAGGIVVILDGGTGAMQMPALITGTGLLRVTGQTTLPTGTNLGVIAPSDAVSVGVVSPYAAGSSSVTLLTEPAAGRVVYVVEPTADGGAQSPVVVHKVF